MPRIPSVAIFFIALFAMSPAWAQTDGGTPSDAVDTGATETTPPAEPAAAVSTDKASEVPVEPPMVPELAPDEMSSNAQPSEGKREQIPITEWDARDWEVVKPQLALVELDGYFRLRADLFHKADLGNGASAFPSSLSGGGTVAGANMRFRLQPTINVTEDIQVVTQIDILDNLVLGSTPVTLHSGSTPINLLNPGQSSPSTLRNAAVDAVRVRHAYGKVLLPGGAELRLGRMPDRWGLGILANDGNGLDDDSGDIADRIQLVLALGNFFLVPAIDWISSGPTSDGALGWRNQPVDLDQLDDAVQYSIAVAQKDAEEDIAEMLDNGEMVLNWGMWNLFRIQPRDTPGFFTDPATIADPANAGLSQEAREGFAWIIDLWGKLYVERFVLEAELVGMYGSFKMPNAGVPGDVESQLIQFGGAMEASYAFRNSLTLTLKSGFASGDRAPGWGVGPGDDSQRGQFDADPNVLDKRIENFQFDPNYHLDYILFREVLGTVTDTWYVQPQVAYEFGKGIGGRFAPIYAQAIAKESTPSGDSAPLGIELDVELFFKSPDSGGIDASLAYAVFFPFGALRNPLLAESVADPDIVHSLQGRLSIVF